MSANRFQSGAIWGLPAMKFTLIYDGPLPSGGNSRHNEDKWNIRKALHPQLKDLWSSHPALKAVEENRHFPKHGGAPLIQTHHLHPGPIAPLLTVGLPGQADHGLIDLCEPIKKHGAAFRPLVRDSFALHCGLKISFLRFEPPGRVYQGGDIDGRMKTLFDALAMPQHVEQMYKDDGLPDPLFVLLEDDSLISGLHVESERLLSQEKFDKDYVKLMIEVDVRVRQATVYNQSFLG